MGQYYKPVVLAENKTTPKAWIYSHDFSNGLKLMEHSYLTNGFVEAFETLIFENPQRVVWGGDYANNCKNRKTNLFDRCNDKIKVIPENRIGLKQGKYILNHTKKTFVDKTKVPSYNDGYRIHPLPLLTCEGCGGGGGDFFGKDNNKIVGSWARDIISVQGRKPKGFTELIFDLIEE